jgi:hypothetical protein
MAAVCHETSLIISEHIVPETKDRMKVFHLIFQLNDRERKVAVVSARKGKSYLK